MEPLQTGNASAPSCGTLGRICSQRTSNPRDAVFKLLGDVVLDERPDVANQASHSNSEGRSRCCAMSSEDFTVQSLHVLLSDNVFNKSNSSLSVC